MKNQICHKCGAEINETNFAAKIKDNYYCVDCTDRVITIAVTVVGLIAIGILTVLISVN